MEVVVLHSEAYNQLQQATLTYVKKLFEEDRKKSRTQWLDNSDAMALLKVSKRTLQTWRDEGRLGFSQVGGKIYYSPENIDLMLVNHAHKPFRALA